jgi:hypothetical protein
MKACVFGSRLSGIVLKVETLWINLAVFGTHLWRLGCLPHER